MAQHDYGADNINWSTFDTWANNISSDANVSLSTANNAFSPARTTQPYEASDFRNQSIFYGTLHVETGGTAKVTGPYTSAQVAAGNNLKILNVLIDANNVVLTATATYPYAFHSWRDAAEGGGSQLGSSTTLTIADGELEETTNFYAYFTSPHDDPES